MSYQMNKISVLVVEDNLPMLEVVKSLLLAFGVGHVITAQDGDVGFPRFCEYNPDLVIADWMMRKLDGISLTRMIRNDPASPNPYVPIILMTGFSERRRVFQARDAGVTEFLVKPFSARDLYKRLAQVIERPRQFVRSTDFFGPDRRRKRAEGDYEGPRRRESDPNNRAQPFYHAGDSRNRQSEAHETLRRIREKAGLEKGDKFKINPDDIDFS